jgi:hypothetical protein
MAQQPLVGQDLLIIAVLRLHSDTPHTEGLLWTCDQPDAVTSTWQHTTLTTDRYPCPPVGFENHNPSKRAAADLCLRPREHWNLQFVPHCCIYSHHKITDVARCFASLYGHIAPHSTTLLYVFTSQDNGCGTLFCETVRAYCTTQLSGQIDRLTLH